MSEAAPEPVRKCREAYDALLARRATLPDVPTTLGGVIAAMPERAAVRSRDFGRGYAMAVSDVLQALADHDRTYLQEECTCPQPAAHTLRDAERADGALWGLYWALFLSRWPWWKDASAEVIDAYGRVQDLIRR